MKMFDRLRRPPHPPRQGPAPSWNKPQVPPARPAPTVRAPDAWLSALRTQSADPYVGPFRAHAADNTSNPEGWRFGETDCSSTSLTAASIDEVLDQATMPAALGAPSLSELQRVVRKLVDRRCSNVRAQMIGKPRAFWAASVLQRAHWPRSAPREESIDEERLRFWCALDLLPVLLEDVAEVATILHEQNRPLFGEAVLQTLQLPSVRDWQRLFTFRPRVGNNDDALDLQAYSEAKDFCDRPPSADLLARVLLACQPWLGAAQLAHIKGWVDAWKPHMPQEDAPVLRALALAEAGRVKKVPRMARVVASRAHVDACWFSVE